MHTKNISYPCEYQRARDANTELTRAGSMLDALGLALHHGDVEDHALDELGMIPPGTASDLDEMLVEIETLGAAAVGEKEAQLEDCSWCGAEVERSIAPRSRAGELFCCRSHRDASARAVKRLRERCEG